MRDRGFPRGAGLTADEFRGFAFPHSGAARGSLLLRRRRSAGLPVKGEGLTVRGAGSGGALIVRVSGFFPRSRTRCFGRGFAAKLGSAASWSGCPQPTLQHSNAAAAFVTGWASRPARRFSQGFLVVGPSAKSGTAAPAIDLTSSYAISERKIV